MSSAPARIPLVARKAAPGHSAVSRVSAIGNTIVSARFINTGHDVAALVRADPLLGRVQTGKMSGAALSSVSLLNRMDNTLAKQDPTTACGFIVQSDDAPAFWQIGNL